MKKLFFVFLLIPAIAMGQIRSNTVAPAALQADISARLAITNNLGDVSNQTTARSNVLPSKTGNALKQLRVNAGETDYELFTPAGGGDLLSTNNLSDLSDAATARTNLGGTTIGKNMFILTNPSAVTFPRFNADNTITPRTAAEFIADLDADLTTWAGITPGSNVGTFLATPSSANLRSALTDENGTGAALFNGATTPDFTTGITVGGAAASGNILQGNGTNYVPTPNTGGWTTLRVSGSNATTTGQVLVDITGLVSGTLTNGTLYEVEATLYVSTSNVSTGTRYAIAAGGSGGAATCFAICQGTTTAAVATQETINTAGTQTATAYLAANSISGIIIIRGYVLTRGAGTATISLQHLKVTSGTSTVLIGSRFSYRLAQ